MTTNEAFLKAVADRIEKILRSVKRPVPADTLADAIKRVVFESPDYEGEDMAQTVSSSDVIDAVKENDKFLKFYGDSIGLKQIERDFWYNELLDILEKEKKTLEIKEIIKRLSAEYRVKFGLDLFNSDAQKGVKEIIEDLTRTFSDEFVGEYEQETNGVKTFFESIGLRSWLSPSVPLVDEIMEILKETNYKLEIKRLCYKINKRKKFYNEDLDISDKEILEIIKKHPDKLKFSEKDSLVELINN